MSREYDGIYRWFKYSYRNDWKSTPEGEALQAEEAVKLYRLLFSHPAVQAITWWDLSDRFALLKKEAKQSPSRTAFQVIKAPGGERALKGLEGSGGSPAFAVFAPKLRAQ